MGVDTITQTHSTGMVSEITNRTPVTSSITSAYSSVSSKIPSLGGSYNFAPPIRSITGNMPFLINEITSIISSTLPVTESALSFIESLTYKLSTSISPLLQSSNSVSINTNTWITSPQPLQALFRHDFVSHITELVKSQNSSNQNYQLPSSISLNDVFNQKTNDQSINTTVNKAHLQSIHEDIFTSNIENANHNLTTHNTLGHAINTLTTTNQSSNTQYHRAQVYRYQTHPEKTPYDERQKRTKQQNSQKKFQNLRRALTQILAKCQQLLDPD